MTPEEIKNTDFETFFQAVPQMKEVHHIKALGQEIYHVYKHDVVYVTRPEKATWLFSLHRFRMPKLA